MTDTMFNAAALWSRARDVARDIDHRRPGYLLSVGQDDIGIYYQVECRRLDAYTGEMAIGYGGRRYLSADTSRDAMVRIAYSLFAQYEEHETREAFHYQGKRIFGPHISIDALMIVADQED